MYSHEFTQSANTWTHHYVVIPGHADLIPGTLFNDEESTEGIGIFFGPHYGTTFTIMRQFWINGKIASPTLM